MPRFAYKAVSSDGEVVEGKIEAASRQAAVDRLHAQGHVPIRAEERQSRAPGRLAMLRLFRLRRSGARTWCS